jgi:hypothetical protein
VSEPQFSLLCDFLCASASPSALDLLAELSCFQSPDVLRFLCSPSTLFLVWSFFPASAASKILIRCFHFARSTAAFIADQMTTEQVAAFLSPSHPDFDTSLDFFSEILVDDSSQRIEVFVETLVSVCRAAADENIRWRGLTSLAKTIARLPVLSYRVFPALPDICAVPDGNSDEVLQLLAAIAAARGDLECIAGVLIFVADALAAGGLTRFFALELLAAVDDVSAAVCPRIVAELVGIIASDERATIKTKAAAFLARAAPTSGSWPGPVDIAVLVPFLESDDIALQALVIRAVAWHADGAARAGGTAWLGDDEEVVAALAAIANTEGHPAAAIAEALLGGE